MIIARFEDNYFNELERDRRKTVIYGAGDGLKACIDKLPHFEGIYDKKADSIEISTLGEIKKPDQLKLLDEKIYILVCVKEALLFDEICEYLSSLDLDATVFHYYNNIAFVDNVWESSKSYYHMQCESKLRVNIVCQDEGWIFRKFAERMRDELSIRDVDVTISERVACDVDINHHIPYAAYKPMKCDTLMITHVDTGKKIEVLKKQLQVAGMGICMSKDTMDKLSLCGVPRVKLCYINPAHDHRISPHRYIIGITHRCYDGDDVRKRASAILDALEGVCPDYFKFIIMGSGWDDILQKMETKGFFVDYYPDFDIDKYVRIMSEIDYYLYMGFDEGSMGLLDALYSGAGAIVTPQGFHLDLKEGIDYMCNTAEDFRNVFLSLQKKRELRRSMVETLTWKNYAKKHIEIWNYLLKRKPLNEVYQNQSLYMDGIFSLIPEDNRL